jgi:hypothetical protein
MPVPELKLEMPGLKLAKMPELKLEVSELKLGPTYETSQRLRSSGWRSPD